MKAARCALSVGLIALWAASAASAAPIIRDIRIDGLESLGEDEVRAVIQSQVGEPLNIEQLQADQRAILNIGIFDPQASGVFAEELVQGAGVNLIFTVRENPVVSRIDIVGNVAERTARIESLIDQQTGERLGHGAERQAQESITDYYRRQGHARARVAVQRTDLPDGTVALRVQIDEGAILAVGEVRIDGNESHSDRRLRFQMETKQSGLLGTNHFSEELFEIDLITLQGFYLDRGYLDATVTRGEFDYDADAGVVHPAIRIEEGPRYRFDGVDVRGNTLFSDLEITAHLEDLSGRWFDADAMRERIGGIREMYGDEGHVNAVVEPRLEPDRAAGVVHVALDIREGPRVHVGAIYLQRSVVGPDLEPPISSLVSRVAEGLSPPVDDETVVRVITLEEGEVYRRFEEVRTLHRLRRLSIFRDVSLERRPTSDPTVEDVFLTVDQQSTGFLGVGVGLGDESGLFGFVRLTENNFGGEADQVRASVQVGTRSLNFDVTYFNRFLADTDLSLRVSGYDTELRRREYDEERTGAQVEIGQPLTDYVQMFYGLRSEYVSFDLDDDATDDTRDAMGSYWLALANVRLTEDHRDDISWPTSGWMRGVSLEAGWADDWLVRIFGEFQYYRRVYRELVLALNLEAGLIPRDRDDVAFGERLFMGGAQDLRGFEHRGVGDVDGDNDDLYIGGTTKVLSQVELRFPIWQQLRGVVFVDAGSLGDDPFEFGTPRASAGTGLRFTLPGFGYLALDVAFPFAKQGEDDGQTLHITFRTDF